jgi:hypothetical protein
MRAKLLGSYLALPTQNLKIKQHVTEEFAWKVCAMLTFQNPKHLILLIASDCMFKFITRDLLDDKKAIEDINDKDVGISRSPVDYFL